MDEPTNDIDPELLAAARLGDEVASRQLVKFLYPTVISIIRNHLPRAEQKEDLAQDVFLKIFTRLNQFRGEKPLRNWAGTIALHTCYDSLRRQRTRPFLSFSELAPCETDMLMNRASDSNDHDASSNGEAARELISKLLSHLKPDHQLVIRLLDLQQHSVREVAEITGWTPSKVKVSALRARRQLTKQLALLEQQAAKSHSPKHP